MDEDGEVEVSPVTTGATVDLSLVLKSGGDKSEVAVGCWAVEPSAGLDCEDVATPLVVSDEATRTVTIIQIKPKEIRQFVVSWSCGIID